MLDIKFIRENPDIVKKTLAEKCLTLDVDELLAIDKKIIQIKQLMEAELQKRNALSKEMPKASPERKEEIKEKDIYEECKKIIKRISEGVDNLHNL